MNDDSRETGTDSSSSKVGDAGLWQRFFRPSRQRSIAFICAVGFAVGVVFWGGFNWSMEMTNTESFCLSCHEMEENVYREYRKTIHYTNRTGVRATCPDCHVPREWGHKMVRKIQASNELLHHLLGSLDTREKFENKRLKLAKNEWKRMKRNDSRECRNCHDFDFMDLTKQENRANRRHEQALKENKTCIDCHKGIAHELPAGIEEAERELAVGFARGGVTAR
ncbi:MAG: Denitrification system component NirT [Gammaproteobacteria bacterium]|nr:MAG: Denitrification system component NirT [Gammaproteobacteria bacterium]